MRSFDMTPLFRSTVGFDRLARLMDTAAQLDENALGYPPYNIEKRGDDTYRVTMAVAGFTAAELTIVLHENVLIVTGRANESEQPTGQFLHRGIARRAFERRFQLADHIRVAGASLVNGLLDIDLVREVPEAMKPRTIAIETGSTRTTIEQKAA